jgi:hypothetical protein
MNLASTRRIFRKFGDKIDVSLLSDDNGGYFTCKPIYIYIFIYHYIALIFFRTKECFSQKLLRKSKHTILTKNSFFQKLCSLWHNVEKYYRARGAIDSYAIRRMRFAFWKTKATDTHSECTLRIAVPQQALVTRTRLNITFILTFSVVLIKIV